LGESGRETPSTLQHASDNIAAQTVDSDFTMNSLLKEALSKATKKLQRKKSEVPRTVEVSRALFGSFRFLPLGNQT
jgi:hypothetical protein